MGIYRIAVITDIHGNIYALNAALNDIKSKSVDYIYCLGDMIGIGPYTNEVLDVLFELNNIEIITGNHDEAVLAILKKEPYPKSRVDVMPHHEWIGERIDDSHIPELEKLPCVINLTIYHHHLHFIHYPMQQKLRQAHISEDPFDVTGLPSPEKFSVINDLDDFSLVCFGHDHSNHQFKCKNTTFFNSGSLGCYNQPYARYGIIDIDKKDYHIWQQYVPYDLDTFVSELRKVSIPRKEIILSIYD
ncbi:metallophosphoesterase family protein [Terrihalobacillus insolitus]|uniref:metallophosphoesterase family protein n=1 Tax=Terrihalobacillus insolitus TaxID=2950438 RepID=UPI00234276FA|nr:metallophosphoesterase family protein [Terrihalobacillus insolitus]MDC3412865.1 metallophosphatase family protein [Terrihalobacillus insolitus]